MPLRVILNGNPRDFQQLSNGTSVTEVVNEMELRPDRVAVELNGEIALRRQWSELQVHDGDKLEVVHFVGGGAMNGMAGE